MPATTTPNPSPGPPTPAPSSDGSTRIVRLSRGQDTTLGHFMVQISRVSRSVGLAMINIAPIRRFLEAHAAPSADEGVFSSDRWQAVCCAGSSWHPSGVSEERRAASTSIWTGTINIRGLRSVMRNIGVRPVGPVACQKRFHLTRPPSFRPSPILDRVCRRRAWRASHAAASARSQPARSCGVHVCSA